jgi:hypothetical protein
MKKFLLLLLLLPFAALANSIDDHCAQFVLRGAPISPIKSNDQYICKGNYAIHYRYDTKTAEYVVEHITLPTITTQVEMILPTWFWWVMKIRFHQNW